LFLDLVDDPICVRFFAVKEMPEFSLHLPGFWSYRAAMRVRCQRKYSLFQSVLPVGRDARLGSILLHIKNFKIAGRSRGKFNVVCHVCGEYPDLYNSK
jgi:hypothetical protein